MADKEYVYIRGPKIGQTFIMAGSVPSFHKEGMLDQKEVVPYANRAHGPGSAFARALAEGRRHEAEKIAHKFEESGRGKVIKADEPQSLSPAA